MTGRIFNEIVGDLLGRDHHLNLHAAIEEIEPTFENWERALVGHTYHRLVGPRLQQQQARLHHLSDQVLTLWDAVQELCAWLAGLLVQARENGDEDLSGFEWRRVEESVSIETEILPPGQRGARLAISGRLEQVWQSPVDQEWILLDLQTSPRSTLTGDLEASLTHLLLQSAGELLSPSSGLKRISFTPTREERLYQAAELRRGREQLFELLRPAVQHAGEIARADSHPVDSGTTGNRLLAALRESGVSVKLDHPVVAAPAFLRFPVVVGERLRRGSTERLAREIQAQLKLDSPPRIVNDGERLLIDLPRAERQSITFDEIRDQLPLGDARTGSAVAPLGITPDGQLRLIDFSRPEDAHLLIAGATGSGKSTWIRTALAGLRSRNTPATLRLLLIDPRGTGLTALRQSPFLLEPIIGHDGAAAIRAISALGDEMERRFQLMENHRVDSLEALIEVTGSPYPRLFGVCDEYADLILNDRLTRRSIETEISRLGQRARTAGIHLILATSQPGREIVRGVIDANFPARIGMRLNKSIESKMVLNQPGAEILLGEGDLLFRDIGELTRLQGIWSAVDAP